MKRQREEDEHVERPTKIIRIPAVDRLSQLSDELLVRILSFSSVPTLLTCQRVSKKIGRIAVDSELWKAAYYNQFVRPRASRISGIKTAKEGGGVSDHLCYSSKLSKWLEDGHLVRKAQKTNWKQQYRLRYNWTRGQCAVHEIVVADRPPEPPLLVSMHDSMIFTADSISGLRIWSSKGEQGIIASSALEGLGNRKLRLPTSMAADSAQRDEEQRIAIGFEDGSFALYAFRKADASLTNIFDHPPSSNGMLSAVAYTSPYLLTMTEDQVLSLYVFPSDKGSAEPSTGTLEPPKILYSLQSYTAWPPVSLSLRTNSSSMTAAIAYAIPTYLSGWTVGVQEMRLSHSGELIESRLATATNPHVHTVLSSRPLGAASSQAKSQQPLFPTYSSSTSSTTPPGTSQPTTMSYSHPYLLAAHPDNTLSLYLVTSTASSLIISPGTRLWGHTSCVSGAYVGGRGKAVSVSRFGDELRVWDLEGGGLGVRRRDRERERTDGVAGGGSSVSVKVQPQVQVQSSPAEDEGKDGVHIAAGETAKTAATAATRLEGLKEALSRRFDDNGAVSRGWVGFDERNVVVLKEKAEGKQTLVVYDFA